VGDVVINNLDDDGTLISWNTGLVFKPAANGSIYLAFGDAQTPPAGDNFVLSATAGNQSNAALEPQKTTTAEIGTKWELLNKSLNVSASVYRTENENQASVDAVTGVATQEGKTRIDGIELAAVGQLTNFWQLSASIGFMESEQLNQSSKSNSTGVISTSDGVRWTPNMTASLWTSYTLDKLTLGGGARYVSEQKRVVTTNTNLATQNMPAIPAYHVVDIMAAYKVSKNTNLRLNVYNVFDEEYLSTLNNGGSRMTLGAPISASIAAEFSF
jgi:catecholate siderophore receptor